MIDDVNDKFRPYTFKRISSPNNNEIVTARVNVINKKYVFYISIGTVICDLIDLNKGDKVDVFSNRTNRNTLLITKSESIHYGYSRKTYC